MLVSMYERWLLDGWGKGDESAAMELLHPKLIDHNPAPGRPAGRAGDIWAAQAVRKAFPDLRFTIDVVFAHDDLVTGRWTMTGTHTGPLDLLGLPPTGRPVRMSGQEIFRALGGQFVEVWHLEDMASMMRCLNLEPPRSMMRLAALRSARSYRRSGPPTVMRPK